MILQSLFRLLTDYLEETLSEIRSSIELEVKRVLWKAGLYAASGLCAFLALEILLGGAFLYLANMPRFIIPAVSTAGLSLAMGIVLALLGRVKISLNG